MHAWFLPADVPRGTRAPTLLEIHGGPGAQFGNSFFHEMQMPAGRGYNVVYADPRGSVGFGYRFAAALAKNWAIRCFVTRWPSSTRSRSAPTSIRSGWVCSAAVRRVRDAMDDRSHAPLEAALAERVVSDMTAAFLACDECSSTSASSGFGNPWDHQDAYWAMSPIASIANVTTPLLLLHSSEDTRTPLVDSDAWFTLARSLGQTITYVQVPRENHDLSRTGEPVHRIERLHLIEDLFGREL